MSEMVVWDAPIENLELEIARVGITLKQAAESLVVDGVESHKFAGQALLALRKKRDLWKADREPHIEGAREAKRVAEANRKRLAEEFDEKDAPLKEAEGIIVEKIGAYEDRLALERAEIQKRLQAKADADAEEQRLAEAIAIEEEIEHASPELAAVLNEEMEQVLDTPSAAPAVVLAPAPRVAGLSRPKYWRWQTDNLNLLLKALIEGKLNPVLTKELNERILEAVNVPLNVRAKADKSALRIPGGRAVYDEGYKLR